METISGVSSWKLTIRREAEHVEILRAVTVRNRPCCRILCLACR